MCDCLVVIQSGEKGGSLITADLANDYHKDVFAFPGRVNDPLSAGCHQLVMRHKAELITSYEDLMERMGWNDEVVGSKKKERIPELFDQLNHDQEKIIRLLQEKDRHIDEILLNTSFSTGKLAAELLSLEMMGHIFSLPGKRYSVVNF
jgi:DNA processing protein